MQSPAKMKRMRSTNLHIPDAFVTFQLYRYVYYGQGVFVCGNLPKLGNWNPALALRLQWSPDNKWIGQVAIPKDISRLVEFKFVVSQWDITPECYKEWEDGMNRVIDSKTLQLQSYFTTGWNRQNFTLCLRTNVKYHENSVYYVTGSIGQLGDWKQKKNMQPIEPWLKKRVQSLINPDSQSLTEAQISTFLFYNFSVPKYLKNFNYFYYRWGQAVQSQNFPGRMIQIDNKTLVQEGRITQIQYLGDRIVIDESCFDDFLLHKITHQIYLASYLKNSVQFNKITEKQVTALLHLESREQNCSIASSRIKSLCKQKGIVFIRWLIQNPRNFKFLDQARQIMAIIQNLIVEGHRVGINCSGQILRAATIKMLYLTLIGHPFKQAVEEVSKSIAVSENNCKVAQCVLQLISQRNRGKFNFHIDQSV